MPDLTVNIAPNYGMTANIAPAGRPPAVDRRNESHDRVAAVLERDLRLPAGTLARVGHAPAADPALRQLATRAQAVVNRRGGVNLSADDLMWLGAARLNELLYRINGDEADDEAEMLRLATEVRTLFGGANPKTIAKLGRDRLEALKAELTPAKATPAANTAGDFYARHAAYDEFAGYDLNNPMGD